MRTVLCFATLALLSACSEPAPATAPPPDVTIPDATADAAPDAAPDVAPDAVPDAAPDVATMDAPADVRRACTRDDDCVFAVEGPACDVASGRCAACVPANDRCPIGQYCIAATNACARGCRDDMACLSATGDGGVSTRRCDTASRRCVQCLGGADCPLGNLCADGLCVPGCDPTRACPAGRSCCEGVCIDTATSVSHCGACAASCRVANGAPQCAVGVCAVGMCTAPFADCDRMAATGCEVDTTTDRSHCGACGATCAPRTNGVATCAAGRCEHRCVAGYADCDGGSANGCEVDMRTTLAHCGACNAVCPSGVCREAVCQPARCDDAVRNGSETDTDCGGAAACPRCALGRRCAAGADCASGECFGGVCGDLDGSSCGATGPVVGPRSGYSAVRAHARSTVFRGVGSLAGDGAGTLWAHDPYGNGASGDRVVRIDAAGAVTTVAAPPGFSTCTSQQLARLPGGDLLLWNITSNGIARITTSGAVSLFSNVSGIGGGGSCSDSGVQGIFARADGSVVVTSPLRSQVIWLRADGTESLRLSGVSGAYRLAADGAGDGHLVSSNGVILRVAADGTRSTAYDAAAAGVGANAIRREGEGDIVFAAGTMVLAIDREGRDLRLVLGCAGSAVTDVLFDRATGGAMGTGLYVSTLGRTIEADDGDVVWEVRR